MPISPLHALFDTPQPTPPDTQTGVNQLLSMNDSMVRQKVGEAFLAQMQNAPGVQPVFFHSAPALLASTPSAQVAWVNETASALIALSLSQVSSHGFAQTVNQANAQNFLTSSLAPGSPDFIAVATSNYQALFAAYCQTSDATPVMFQKYLNGSLGPAQQWGTALAQTMKSTAYIDQAMIKLNPAVDPSGWYQEFYANLYKVQMLNNAELSAVLSTWDPYLHGQEHSTATSWTIYDHMLASSYTYSTFFSQVQTAISVSSTDTTSSGCQGGPAGQCYSHSTTTYGGQVNNWLSSNNGLGGFVTGVSNGNVETGGGGGGCCFIPGTPILLANGSTQAIEEIVAGTRVISSNGAVLQRSEQNVHWPIAEHELLYGFNEYPPFFNASHPFMTTSGWKAMSVRAAREINPDLDLIGELQVGDVLLQAVSGPPFSYVEVPIENITRMLARDAATHTVYSLHLDVANPGYHANGFLVAVNYPTLREDHFVKAFADTTPAERAYLRSHFQALAPFLRRGLGGYISEILRRALGDDAAYGTPQKGTVTHN